MIIQNLITVPTTDETDIIDITSPISNKIMEADFKNGAVFLFVPGSTASLSTIEFESGVINDLKKAIQRIAPDDIWYEHNEKWGDGNGYAHVRAALLGPSLQIPVANGKMLLGTWQQIVLLDFDNRPRKRQVLIQFFN